MKPTQKYRPRMIMGLQANPRRAEGVGARLEKAREAERAAGDRDCGGSGGLIV